MSSHPVASFSDRPKSEAERRLRDVPDRVVEGDPRHVTRIHFESPDGKLIAGT